jgi:hypothetical protein
MPAQPITLGPIHFRKKADAEAFLKAMLDKYDLGDRVSVDDTVVLKGALARHPEAAAKMGSGITHFSVRTADFGTRCFWVNRTDGTTVKFSYRSCIYG